ncbi:protein kinase domain-containing protein, partial [Clostridium novyi]|uniref:protein kinase domain-containing protein n=1 Tax=Clostridium novyi TaxID=1542 RepID=UPI0004DA186C
MELINNKYKIIKKIEQNRKSSSYAVQDIVDNKIRKLIIINSDYLSKTLINFLINNFTDLSNVETEGILKVFNFGLVSSIDNKRLAYKQYYYTSEYLKDYYKANDLIENLSYKEIIDVYVQVCMAINYLNLRGIKYEEINLENILLYKKDNKLKVKLMDLVTLEVESSYLKGEIKGGLIFKAPEILNGDNPTIESEIYSLGVLAVILFFIKNNIKVDFKTDVYSTINDNLLEFDQLYLNEKIIKIIKKMISNNPKDRYHNINEMVHDMNKVLGTNYAPYNISEIEKINVNTPVVDREYELKTIISEYRFMKEKHGENKCIFVHGETGIGKTKILKEVERILSLDGVSVYSTFPSSNNGRNKNLIEFCKKIIYSCRESIGETYKEEFEKFIPQTEEDKNFISLESMCSFHEKVRLFKISENFIKEVFKEKSSVIIIDNISVFKKISLEALEYVYNSESIKNLIIILSYNEEDLLEPGFFNFINRMNKNNSTINIPLKGLSFEGTACLIEKLLGLSEYPIKFSKKIYSETYGNPLFIEETIKNLLLNEIIYVEEETGKWDIAYNGDYDSLPMPKSIEQAFVSELNKIGAESYFILEFISIFTDGVSQKIIEEFMKKDGLNYDDIIEDLTSKGILCRKIEDAGFVYDFCSKILKDLVYEKIDEKVEMHREAGELLIKCGENNIENREEVIYHLERSNQNIRAVEYYIENASKMILLRNHREALFNLKKASQLLPYRYNDEKTRILLKMADIYMDLFKFKSAKKILQSAKNIVLETKNKKDEIDVLNREGNIYLNENNYIMAFEKINLVDEILKEIEYKKGFIDSRIILANIYYKKDEYDKVVDTCNEGIIVCGNEFIKPKVVLYNIRGNGNRYLKNFDEAVRDYGLVYKNSKSTDYKKGIVFAYINLAKIYEDYYQISDISEEYLMKVTDICEKN